MIGWLPLELLSTTEGVNKPREEFLKVHEQNKLGLLHLIKDDKQSVCKKAVILTGLFDIRAQSNAINDPDNIPFERKSYINYLVCNECYNSKDREQLIQETTEASLG